jgi:selenocysteine-specific elongation factor
MPSTPAVRRVVLGTAGHIDHGKTTLVERLTGTRTDRLPEEQERGMTIDVGYATFVLPDGTEVGLLDVPGHERLVRTMVAGATAMDLVVLVVAADDGPMPQTREHVGILDVLGIRHLVVALTKCDLADETMSALAEEEVRSLLAGTAMEGAKFVRVSNETREGLDLLQRTIVESLPPPKEDRPDLWAFRMPVLRAFTAPGRGTVVTGIPLSGRVADGEAVDLLPDGIASRVRGIQVHHRPATEARAHHRAALALSDVEVARVKRGMVVATAGVLKPARRFAVRARILRSATEGLEHRRRARLHIGADQVLVRAHLLEGSRIEPGAEGIVELEAARPVVALPGDRFVLREENAAATLGGGTIVEVLPARLPRRAGIARALMERSDRLDDPAVLVVGSLVGAAEEGLDAAAIAALAGLRPEVVPPLVERLVAAREAVKVGRTAPRIVHAAAFARVREKVEDAVKRLHAKDPAMGSLSLAAVRAAAGRADASVLDAAVDSLVADGTLVRTDGGGVRHKAHAGSLSGADQARADRILGALASGRGQPPATDELEASTGLPTPELVRLLRVLENRGLVFRAGDFWFHAGWLAEAKGRLASFARANGGFTPSDARSVLDSTRKWVIPLLEALDKTGFCRRSGERRVVREG